MTRLIPHPGYRLLWLALHGGAFVGWLVSLWLGWSAVWPATGYIAAVALLEAIALLRIPRGGTGDGTFSWSVWAFLADGTGFRAFWRLSLVGFWVVWFLGLWLVYVPIAVWTKGPIALGFGLWLWAHFFGKKLAHEVPHHRLGEHGRGTSSGPILTPHKTE